MFTYNRVIRGAIQGNPTFDSKLLKFKQTMNYVFFRKEDSELEGYIKQRANNVYTSDELMSQKISSIREKKVSYLYTNDSQEYEKDFIIFIRIDEHDLEYNDLDIETKCELVSVLSKLSPVIFYWEAMTKHSTEFMTTQHFSRALKVIDTIKGAAFFKLRSEKY